ncbi:hypothetical protein [Bordetella genomosp. 13]|uniref:hypothetical protein n=1 Tax=Bordetella genomosp. 13 TaxID=463040 RepID=UPI0011A861D5|nr:hypothetical protein [Bordetella genomosp. 13]
MGIKPTVIGDAAARLEPTRLDKPGAQPDVPAASSASPARPGATILPATVMQSPAPLTLAATRIKPTAMPAGTPIERPTPVAAPLATALPGTRLTPIDVDPATLAMHFPGYDLALMERVRGVLLGVSPQTMSTDAWLAFGLDAQQELATLVKQRLALMEATTVRAVTQHLRRLQELLADVLESLSGGFLKRSATRVWADVHPEVRDLETLLSQAARGLRGVLADMEALDARGKASEAAIQARAMAAEYLADTQGERIGQLLAPRAISLSTSQALAVEQRQALELDQQRIRELMALVQDGVLLQLTAVYSQMAALAAKPSETQRFLAREKLDVLVQFIQRKL